MERECQQVGSEGEGGAGQLEEPALRTKRVEEAEDRVENSEISWLEQFLVITECDTGGGGHPG